MPVFAAPAYLIAALAASAVVAALHLLAWRRPHPTPLPTARFAPPSAVRALSRDLRLSDALLLALRVLALLLAGVALARPSLAPRRAGAARVVVIDASRRVASVDQARDSARAHLAGADDVVWIRVDSAATLVTDSTVGGRAEVRGRLGAGIVAAIREAHRLARTRARTTIVVVSPFAVESWDAGLGPMRGTWDGEIVPVRVAARAGETGVTATGSVAARAARPELPPLRDPLGAAFALALDAAAPPVRVKRGAPNAADSAWAREGGIVIAWPGDAPGDGGAAGEPVSDVLTTGGRSVVGHFGRPGTGVPPGAAILRWGDGTPAATEASLGRGCLRSVGVAVPVAGDEALRPAFLRVVRELAGACGGGGEALLDSAAISAWARPRAAGEGTPTGAVAGGAVRSARGAAREPSLADRALQRWLLLAVAAVLLAEWIVRARRATGGSAFAQSAAAQPREAA